MKLIYHYTQLYFTPIILIIILIVVPTDFEHYKFHLLELPFILTILSFSIILLIAHLFYNKKTLVNVTLIDIIILLFWSFTLFSNIYSVNNEFNNLSIVQLCCLVLLYFNVRYLIKYNLANLNHILFLLALIGFSQVILGYLQFFGIVSNMSDFALTGIFINPGQLANFLIILFAILLGLILFCHQHRYLRYITIIMLVLSFIQIIICNARTIWLAMALIILFYLNSRYKLKSYILSKFSFKKIILLALAIIATAALFYLLYQYKKDSSEGRLFVWQQAIESIKEKPLIGHGYRTFEYQKFLKQSRYFINHPNDKRNIILANGNPFAFNEFLKIAVEEGLIGLLLFVSVIVLCLINKQQQGIELISKAGIIGIIMAAMFSYPFQSPQIMFFMFLFFAFVQINNTKYLISFKISYLYKVVIIVCSIIILTVCLLKQIKLYNNNRLWCKTGLQLEKTYNENELLMLTLSDIYYNIPNDPQFIYNYGITLGMQNNYEKSIEILKKAEKKLPNYDLFIAIALNYEKTNNYFNAETYYLKASNFIPLKFTPKYRLMKMYEKNGNHVKAIAMANNIINADVKIYSPEISKIKTEALALIRNNE